MQCRSRGTFALLDRIGEALRGFCAAPGQRMRKGLAHSEILAPSAPRGGGLVIAAAVRRGGRKTKRRSPLLRGLPSYPRLSASTSYRQRSGIPCQPPRVTAEGKSFFPRVNC